MEALVPIAQVLASLRVRVAELEAVIERVRELTSEMDRSMSPRDAVDAIVDVLPPRRLTPEECAQATTEARQLREKLDKATSGMEE